MEKPQEDLENKTLDPSPTTTETAAESNPPKNPNPPSVLVADDPRTEGKGKDEKKGSNLLKPSNGTVAALEAVVATGATVDLVKKLRRAERFGVAVQLSEEEKRRTRAERFGTATGSLLHCVKNGRNQEEQKRKARAERFGLAVHSSVDEEEKKKARLERFGQKSKPDTSEEEKMKARVARFSRNIKYIKKRQGQL